jgi:hypothetical protein
VRNSILQELLQACKDALLQTVIKDTGTSCRDKMCPVRQAGVMLKGPYTAGLYPLPDQAFAMHGSIKSYLTGLRSMGDDYVGLVPKGCNSNLKAYVTSTGSTAYKFTCACFDDYGIATRVKTILRSHVHADIVKQWEKVSTPETTCIIITDRCRKISSKAMIRCSETSSTHVSAREFPTFRVYTASCAISTSLHRSG